MSTNNKLSARLISVGDLPLDRIQIPNYQRPYRWKEENVEQLLQDIKNNTGEYRIGSLILHENKGTLDLVDGQQRVTTLMLIIKALGDPNWERFRAEYDSNISKTSIRTNYAFVRNWLRDNTPTDSSRQQYLQHILVDCKVTVIIAQDLAEAFQMFDSQNGHGKELLAYNLLKAFHIRAIDRSSKRVVVTDIKKEYDRRWEEAARHPRIGRSDEYIDLMSIITQRLYHIRLWSRQLESSKFDKTKLKEFKGIQLEEIGKQSPYVYAVAKLVNEDLFSDSNSMATDKAVERLLNTSMPLINGKAFFEYILKYVRLYSRLFLKDPEPLPELDTFYKDYQSFVDYSTGRVGDRYIKELYQALVLAVYDKFGAYGVNQYYKTLYALAYRLRLEFKQVRFITVCRQPLYWFSVIESAYSVSDLSDLLMCTSDIIECYRFEENIAKFILDNSNATIVAKYIITDENENVRFQVNEDITTEKLHYSHE